jgi:crotonobetainyl-CoA:carnitine CoA-transferase CaiB-like acyl-CoA transferase
VEPLGGDPYRHMGDLGVLTVKTTAGKQSLCVDLKRAEGQRLVQALCSDANAVVHNFRPGVPERLGVGYEQLRALRADIVWVSATGYGPDAPSAHRPATHPIPGAAMGGALLQAGAAMPPPECETLDEVREAARQLMRANEPNPDPNTSVAIASATLLALLAQRRHGVGQAVFVNMFVANAYANADDFLRYEGKPSRATVDAELHGYGPGYRLYPARSGWIFLAVRGDEAWRRFFDRAAFEDLAADRRFETEPQRETHADALVTELTKRFATRDADAWEAALASAGVGCVTADAAPPGTFFIDDAHVRENGFAPEATHRRFGRTQRWAPLVTVDGGRSEYQHGVLAGQDTDRILAGLGKSASEIAELRAAGVVGDE